MRTQYGEDVMEVEGTSTGRSEPRIALALVVEILGRHIYASPNFVYGIVINICELRFINTRSIIQYLQSSRSFQNIALACYDL